MELRKASQTVELPPNRYTSRTSQQIELQCQTSATISRKSIVSLIPESVAVTQRPRMRIHARHMHTDTDIRGEYMRAHESPGLREIVTSRVYHRAPCSPSALARGMASCEGR